MKRIILLAAVSWSVVPFKAWSRFLFGGEGFNVGDIVLIVVLAPVIYRMMRGWVRSDWTIPIAVILVSLLLSIAKGLVWAEPVREILRLARATILWAVVPLVIQEIRDPETFRRFIATLAVLLVVVCATIVIFSIDPGLVPADDDMAVARDEWFGGFQRIFHLGMWGVFAGSIVALGTAFRDRRWRIPATIVGSLLALGLALTFIRTFIILLVIAAGVFYLQRARYGVRSLVLPLVVSVLVFWVVSRLPFGENLFSAASDRISHVVSIDLSDIDPTDQEGVGTLLWRVLEAETCIQNMDGWWDQLLGAVGRNYTMIDGFSATMPHISYVGIFYTMGFIGLVSHFGVIGYSSFKLISNVRRTGGDEFGWIQVPVLVAWVMLLLGAFNAALFQFPY